MTLRRLFTFLLPTAAFILLALVLHHFARPTIIIEFTEPFDPINTRVTLGNTKLYPSGAGGRVFNGRGSVFRSTQNVKVSGALVAPEDISIATKLFGTSKEAVSLTARTPGDVVTAYLGSDEFTDTRAFGDKWIVSLPAGHTNEPDHERSAIVLYYDTEKGEWVDATGSVISASTTVDVPQVVRSYFLELSDD